MNFFEAIEAMKNGGSVSIGDSVYKIENNVIYVKYIYESKNIWSVGNIIGDCIDGKWKIYKPERENNGLWVKGHNELHLGQYYNGSTPAVATIANFSEPHIWLYWEQAIITFMKLKGHPLAVKANDYGQFFIHIGPEHANVPPFPEDQLGMKIYNFSPMFETMADAETALEDIGEENLVKMAKVFQGIYK
jgi:hypothetical protein